MGIGAKMASEKLKHFLSRKCGRIETAFEQLDHSGNGFINMQDWLDGLAKMEYDHMEYAQEVCRLHDTRQHHVLTVSDLTGRRGQCVYDGVRVGEEGPDEEVAEEMLQLLREVLAEEVNAVVKESMHTLALSALRSPQPPIKER